MNRSRNTCSASRNRTSQLRFSRLAIETVEERHMMTVGPIAAFDRFDMVLVQDSGPTAEGNISYDAAARRVTVDGTNRADTLKITINNMGTATTTDDMLSISLANINSPLTKLYRPADVQEILFNALAGDDYADNLSWTKLRAYGGAGNDILLGGSGDDFLVGDDNDDFIDGRVGHDMIWGLAGADKLFGDAGIDLILGGLGSDYIFGGDGDDSLYGEDGNDWLGGGAGVDKLNGGTGTNTLKADYGATVSLVNGFQTFDWFDKNLADPGVRSAARVGYRDMILGRSDMLDVYTTVSRDNYVTTNEFADLKDLVSTNLTEWDMYRSLAKKVVNGDRANGWFQGSTLGNLAAGSSGAHLNNLVNKWFKGGDLPGVGNTGAQYRYVSGNLFVNGISFTDVDQGASNDCYFMAAIGETALLAPSKILNMFYDNGDGTYTVRFYRGTTSEYVTVNRFLPVNMNNQAVYAGWGVTTSGANTYFNTNNELWVALAEKAYVQMNESGWLAQENANNYVSIDFGWPGTAIGHITGKSSSDTSLSSAQSIIDAFNASKVVTFTSNASGVAAGLVNNHCYMLVGYNTTTKTFRLFNPHGLATPTDTAAYVDLTWNQLKANFRGWMSVKL